MTAAEPIWWSRWDVCNDCGCATTVSTVDNPQGVPDVEEWDRQQCLVCGSSLGFGNADGEEA